MHEEERTRSRAGAPRHEVAERKRKYGVRERDRRRDPDRPSRNAEVRLARIEDQPVVRERPVVQDLACE